MSDPRQGPRPGPRQQPNALRYVAGDDGGHYESFFLRGNHAERPLAFWIRYTIFSPKGRPGDAVGELWAAYFDGETGKHVAAKLERPIDECAFTADRIGARIANATLDGERLAGSVTGIVAWDLAYRSDEPPLLLFPDPLYDRGFPRAKALVGAPLARFTGTLEINGQRIAVDDWVGSQNHNWGSRHTDRYAWGQVAGFDGAPETFLEVATAQVKLGPIYTPRATVLVLRHRGAEIAINGLARSLRNRGSYRLFDWEFEAVDRDHRVSGRISAPAESFVGLSYANPPGGAKHCLNSKIAACELSIEDRGTGARESLSSAFRAAFEILVDPDRDHGVKIRC